MGCDPCSLSLITRFGEWLDLKSLDLFLLWFLQAYLLVMVVIELGRPVRCSPTSDGGSRAAHLFICSVDRHWNDFTHAS